MRGRRRDPRRQRGRPALPRGLRRRKQPARRRSHGGTARRSRDPVRAGLHRERGRSHQRLLRAAQHHDANRALELVLRIEQVMADVFEHADEGEYAARVRTRARPAPARRRRRVAGARLRRVSGALPEVWSPDSAWCPTRTASSCRTTRAGSPGGRDPRRPAPARAPSGVHEGTARRAGHLPMGETGTGCRASRSCDRPGRPGHLPRARAAGRVSGREAARRRRQRVREAARAGHDRHARRLRRQPRSSAASRASGPRANRRSPPASRAAAHAGRAAAIPGGEARKVGSIGIHVNKGVTTHGLAINVNNDLQPFDWVVPAQSRGCG